MKIKRIWDVEGVEIPEPFKRIVRVIFAPDRENVKELNLISAIIHPYSSTDYRPRDRIELIYIVSGRGVFVCNDKEYPIEPDTAILVEKGDKIQVKNTHEETLKLVSVYVQPFKAEELYQKLKEMAEKARE